VDALPADVWRLAVDVPPDVRPDAVVVRPDTALDDELRPDVLPAPVCLRAPVPVVPAAPRLLPVPLERFTVLILSPLLYLSILFLLCIKNPIHAGFRISIIAYFFKKEMAFFPFYIFSKTCYYNYY